MKHFKLVTKPSKTPLQDAMMRNLKAYNEAKPKVQPTKRFYFYGSK